MTNSERQAFRELMGKLYVVYQREPDTVQTQFFWDTLKDLELAELQVAAVQVAKELKWFPKPAELRAAVFQQRHALRQARDAALMAMPVDLADHCEHCSDTGWKQMAGGMSQCPCRTTNPVYQRRMAHVQAAAAAHGASKDEAPNVVRALKRGARDFRQLSAGEPREPGCDDE